MTRDRRIGCLLMALAATVVLAGTAAVVAALR
jgi:hypothetical protein